MPRFAMQVNSAPVFTAGVGSITQIGIVSQDWWNIHTVEFLQLLGSLGERQMGIQARCASE